MHLHFRIFISFHSQKSTIHFLIVGEDPEGFSETEDHVELNGVRISKPFVEKPAIAENHDIHIYYPFSMVRGPN